MTSSLQSVSALHLHSDSQITVTMRENWHDNSVSVCSSYRLKLFKVGATSYTCVCVCTSFVGRGVQPAVCAPRAPVQEAVCGPLPGLRQERQRHSGWLCGAGTAQDGGPDAGLRPVHISKSADGGRPGLEALVSSLRANEKSVYLCKVVEQILIEDFHFILEVINQNYWL